uniref:ATP synthase subunit a n=1 Tax=Pseudocalotes microlepis TaxID=1963763 RepID=A0A384T9H6_9SAUR|nr:ATP synthase F0 subunit 6 [Pseudocalotes microlepis]AQU64359.1 ATP synthase F0 subunit 6 [Pseudocalotes microlepis]QGN67002.1 ATP synthase F0 subunit 6 [Pseudocalotes microlepis]
MTLNLFDQFNTPQLFNTSLLPAILLLPIMIVQIKTYRLKNNRLTTIYTWLIKKTMKTIMVKMPPLGQKWTPMLTALVLLLATMNTTGLLPYTFTPTTQLSTTLALAAPLWLATVMTGMRNFPSRSLAHLLPEGTPTPLIPILIFIETASLLIRPLALGVRLTANLTAGHLLLQLVSLAIMATMSTTMAASAFTATLLVLLTILEMAVALIQAYVFALLITLYLQENA